jgi:hypothetical protein
MAHAYLVFDFGAKEEAAQQARHRLEGWKQAFRLGNKVLFKFERQESESGADSESKAAGKKKAAEPAADSRVRMIVRLDFSNHEKHLSRQWLERIPAEEPFHSAKGEVIRQGEATFDKTAELFDSLN